MSNKLGTDKVFEPGPNRVFVFGSNMAGIHGAGAAAHAKKHYGATQGIGIGWQGSSYAIPTKDEHIETLPLERIKPYVDEFIRHAKFQADITFFVTRIGCGLAGYTDADIAPMFREAPSNCELPYGWPL